MDIEVAIQASTRERSRMMVFRVENEFTQDLGGRYRTDGDFSGEEFREDFLLPRFDEALGSDDVLCVNFDGVSGMPTSFLEEAFGGLVRSRPQISIEEIVKHLKIEAPKSPKLWHYIKFTEDAMRRAARRSR